MTSNIEVKTHAGGCHCGRVRYTVHGELRPVLICHCYDCMKTIGNSIAATAANKVDTKITGDDLKWYQSSDIAERGFCQNCGAALFYRQHAEETISITAGTLDDASVLSCAGQIYAHQHPGFMPLCAEIDDLDDAYAKRHEQDK